jgi:hypothetical protein
VLVAVATCRLLRAPAVREPRSELMAADDDPLLGPGDVGLSAVQRRAGRMHAVPSSTMTGRTHARVPWRSSGRLPARSRLWQCAQAPEKYQ